MASLRASGGGVGGVGGASAAAAAGEWEQLRVEARKLEGRLEEHLREYSKFNASWAAGRAGAAAGAEGAAVGDVEAGGVDSAEAAVERSIEAALKALGDVNDRMSRCVGAGGGRGYSNSALLQRYREILHDYSTEYKKINAQITHRRESAQLMAGMDGARGALGDSEPLLRERSAIQSSHRAIDSIMSQASETKESLRSQRDSFLSANSTLGQVAAKFPAANKLMSAIQSKKQRNNVILALVIAGCICFTLYYVMR